MKRFYFLFLFYLVFLNSVVAQNLLMDAISSQGAYSNNGVFSLEWTLGETIVGTYISNQVLTQGFNQPFIKKEIDVLNTPGNIVVYCYPNPVQNELNIFFKSPTLYSFSISDIVGLKVWKKTCSINQQHLAIKMNGLIPGIYLLTIYDNQDVVVKTIKVVKI